MPDYLIIDVSDGRSIEAGGKVIRKADSAEEALASLLGTEGYRYAAEYVIFDLEAGVHIKTEQSRTVALIDGKDRAGTTVLATYDEAALAQLKDARAQAVQLEAEIKR